MTAPRPAKRLTRKDHKFILRLYYDESYTRAQIAQWTQYSRSQIQRVILRHARKQQRRSTRLRLERMRHVERGELDAIDGDLVIAMLEHMDDILRHNGYADQIGTWRANLSAESEKRLKQMVIDHIGKDGVVRLLATMSNHRLLMHKLRKVKVESDVEDGMDVDESDSGSLGK